MRPAAYLLLTLCFGVSLRGAAAQAPAAVPPPVKPPGSTELIEDLRILAIVNPLELTTDQTTRLAAVATSGKEGLAAIDEQVKAKLDAQRERLLAARDVVLRGGTPTPFTEEQVALATASAQALRTQRTEELIVNLAGRVRRILTAEQASRIEDDLAPTGDQPWRRYARELTGAGGAIPAATRMPTDPGYWLHELRDLRTDSAEGDPKVEIADFGKKMTRGIRNNTPLYEQALAAAQAFATQVLSMPPELFVRQERDLARLASRQELSTRNQQRALEGKPGEAFDPQRWLVEQVLLSPRAAATLRDEAAAHR